MKGRRESGRYKKRPTAVKSAAESGERDSTSSASESEVRQKSTRGKQPARGGSDSRLSTRHPPAASPKASKNTTQSLTGKEQPVSSSKYTRSKTRKPTPSKAKRKGKAPIVEDSSADSPKKVKRRRAQGAGESDISDGGFDHHGRRLKGKLVICEPASLRVKGKH